MTLLQLLSIFLVLFSFSTKPTTLTQAQCLPDQSHALLRLRQGFNTTELGSWNASTDCCKWDGVICDQLTGHVTALDLTNRSILGELNPALFNLTSLKYLNLAYNIFYDIHLPQTGFERLANLTHLNLSYNSFAGQVPMNISVLTNLISLDLSRNDLHLHDPGLPTLLNNLTKLQVLRLDWVNISSNGSEWGNAISKVGPTLQELSLQYCSLTGPIDPSLIQLKQLKLLQLGWNDLNSHVPVFFANFSSLSVFSLESCGLIGDFPVEMLHHGNLTQLDLSDNPMLSGQLPEFTKKRFLQYLDLSNTNFTGPIPDSIGNLQFLSTLKLSRTNFSGPLPNSIENLQYLSTLDLSFMNFTGPIPNSIGNLQYLSTLDLSFTNFTGPIPGFIGNLQYLSTLDLSNSGFYGEISASIANLARLTRLDFSGNTLTGTIPMSLFSHPSLISLSLAENQFSGYLSEFSNGSPTLEVIELGSNNLQGQLPISIFKLPQLYTLNLGSNNFTGTLNLDVIKHSKNLSYLDLSNNKLSITDGENLNKSFYASFPDIYSLYLTSCNLTKIPSFLRYQRDIELLDLSNNKIEGVIPNWLWSNKYINSVNLSHNLFTNIEGNTPFIFLEELTVLDIHSNIITGPVPLFPPNIRIMDFSSNYFFLLPSHFASSHLFYLSLSNNSLTGEIPLSICNFTHLALLDLSYNNLTGTVPTCLLEGAKSLAVLNLKSNKLSGTFPRDISQECGFSTINLNGNRIKGSLPRSLMNCNALEVLDLGNNQIVDRFPDWLGKLNNLRVLILRSNQFYGTISNMKTKKEMNDSFFPMLKVFDLSSNRFSGTLPKTFFENLKAMMTNSNTSTLTVNSKYPIRAFLSYKTLPSGAYSQGYYQNAVTVTYKGHDIVLKNSLGIFSSLDLSRNGFCGEIPEKIGQLLSLDLLNLSHNALIGPIPSQFSNLEQIESLDLSFNQLSGHIPQELTSLTFLSSLNLSYNNLDGEIPQARQFSTFSNDSYLGNPRLCGSPLSMQCVLPPSNPGFEVLPYKSSTDIIGLAVSIGLGFGVGFASVIWTLASWENGRKRFNFNIDRFYFRHVYQWKFVRALYK